MPAPRRHPPARRLPSLLAGLLLPLAAPAAAEVAAGLHAGTLGLGAEISFGFTRGVVGRLAVAAWDHDFDLTAGGIDYSGDLELRNLAALVDLHPGGGAFHFTLGAVLNDNRLFATAPLRALLEDELGQLPIPPGIDLGILRGTATGETLAPYAGLGWGNPIAAGWSLRFDLGVAYLGSPDVRLEVDTPIPVDQLPGGRPLLDRLLAEQQAELEAEVEDAELYPVVAFALSWRF